MGTDWWSVPAFTYDVVPAGHHVTHVLELSAYVCVLRKVGQTIVIGIFGAFGKMNLMSSNLPRRRQFSASEILPLSVPTLPASWAATHHPAPL